LPRWGESSLAKAVSWFRAVFGGELVGALSSYGVSVRWFEVCVDGSRFEEWFGREAFAKSGDRSITGSELSGLG
jgi:hypothetical protein